MAEIAFLHSHSRLPTRVVYQARALAGKGHKVKAFCWDRSDGQCTNEDNGIPRVGIAVRAPSGTNRVGLYLPRLYRKLGRVLQREDFDIVHCTHLMLLPLAVRLAAKRKIKVVYDAYEFYSVDLSSRFGWLARPARAILEQLEDRLVARVDGVVTIDSRGGKLVARYKARCSNVQVLFNVPDLSIRPDQALTCRLAKRYEGQKLVLYAGGIFKDKGAGLFVQVLSKVKRRHPDVKFLLLGEFQDNSLGGLKAEALRAGAAKDLEFLGWVGYRQLLSYLSIANVGLALHQPTELRFWELGQGNGRKFFDYMRSGLPIICPAFAEVSRLIMNEECGYAVDTADPDAVAERVSYLLQHPAEARAMGERGQRAIVERYNWEHEQHKVLDLYDRVSGSGKGDQSGGCKRKP